MKKIFRRYRTGTKRGGQHYYIKNYSSLKKAVEKKAKEFEEFAGTFDFLLPEGTPGVKKEDINLYFQKGYVKEVPKQDGKRTFEIYSPQARFLPAQIGLRQKLKKDIKEDENPELTSFGIKRGMQRMFAEEKQPLDKEDVDSLKKALKNKLSSLAEGVAVMDVGTSVMARMAAKEAAKRDVNPKDIQDLTDAIRRKEITPEEAARRFNRIMKGG